MLLKKKIGTYLLSDNPYSVDNELDDCKKLGTDADEFIDLSDIADIPQVPILNKSEIEEKQELPNVVEKKKCTNLLYDNTYSVDNELDDGTKLGTDAEKLLDFSDLSDILQTPIPEKRFEYKLPTHSNFNVRPSDWLSLKSEQKGRCFKSGTWQHVFLQGVTLYNPYCSFIFLYHKVSSSVTESSKGNHFSAKAKCKFYNCPVIMKLSMSSDLKVTVCFNGDVSHVITEIQSRPIRGMERQMLKEEFKLGVKPLHHYLTKFKNKDPQKLLQGTLMVWEIDTHVYRQIASESRHNRSDKDALTSLMLLMDKMKKTDGYGFIQKICAKPSYILYWSNEGMKIFHKLAHKLPLFWDATGNVVRRGTDGKKYLYYELTIQNPTDHKMGIPIAGMVSEDHSLPTVLDWIECFRQGEKKLFGYSNICQPKSITSDQSWVFILSALKVFNNEDLSEYLIRLWKQLGTVSDTSDKKTAVHLCTSHIMNNFKKFLMKNYKKHAKFALTWLGLLLNTTKIEKAAEILHDILVCLQVPVLNDRSLFVINRLITSVNSFSTDTDEMETDNLSVELELSPELKPGYYTEEDFLSLADTSPFKTWGNNISTAVNNDFNQNTLGDKNQYQSEIVAKHILQRLLPIFPLWSTVFKPQFSSMNDNSENKVTCRTNSTIENRFRLLKHLCLGGNKMLRLDDFSVELQSHTVNIQRLCAVSYLKQPNGSQKGKKILKTIQENWNKSSNKTPNLKNHFGKFQRPPTHPFPEVSVDKSKLTSEIVVESHESVQNECTDIKELYHKIKGCDHEYAKQQKPVLNIKKESKCPMLNIHSSCWFNASMQALSGTFLAKALIEKLPNVIDIDDMLGEDIQSILFRKICSVLSFMCTTENFGKQVPPCLLEETLAQLCHGSQRRLLYKKQNDVCEFINGALSDIAEKIGHKIQINKIFTCKICSCTLTKEELSIVTLALSCATSSNTIHLQELVSLEFQTRDADVACSKCGKPCTEQNTISTLPMTLFIVINRFQFINNKTVKIVCDVIPDDELDFSAYVSNTNTDTNARYTLKSVIIHTGTDSTSGHYIALTKEKETAFFTMCNDMNITNAYPKQYTKDCYVAVYDKITEKIPDCFPSIVSSFAITTGIQWSLDNICRITNDKQLQQLLMDIKNNNVNNFASEFEEYYQLNKLQGKAIINQFSVCDVIDIFYSYVFEGKNRNAYIGVDSFCVIYQCVSKCNGCNLSPNVKSNDTLVLKISNINSLKSRQSIFAMQHANLSLPCTQCQSIDISNTVFITSIPHTIIISMEVVETLTIDDFRDISVLNVTDVFPNVIGPLAWINTIWWLLCQCLANVEFFLNIRTTN